MLLVRTMSSSKLRRKAPVTNDDQEEEDIQADQFDTDDVLDTGRQGDKYYAYLIRLLSGRQARAAVLGSALNKLELVRNMMRTKGQHVKIQRTRDAQKHNQYTDLVAEGKVTPFGIALPGYEDAQAGEDYQDSFGFSQRGFKGQPKPPKKSYKWSNERKR